LLVVVVGLGGHPGLPGVGLGVEEELDGGDPRGGAAR
jgi:hypothetical protein